MKALAWAAAALLVGACAAPRPPQPGAGATPVGAPELPFDAGVLDRVQPDAPATPEREAVQLPDRLTIPASYRLMVLDGHLALVRETDSQALEASPASLRVVAGEIARGELAFQPGLLPQELAAEVSANRGSSARMDNALEAVMRRSRELSEQALELEAQARRLEDLLSASEARVRQLEADARTAPSKAAPESAAAKDPQE
jgi:hypothetical protein